MKTFLSFINPILRIGSKRPIEREDIPSLIRPRRAELLNSELDQLWAQECKKIKPSIIGVLWKVHQNDLILLMLAGMCIEGALNILIRNEKIFVLKMFNVFINKNPFSYCKFNKSINYRSSGRLVRRSDSLRNFWQQMGWHYFVFYLHRTFIFSNLALAG